MKRLFLLSMAFFGSVMLFIVFIFSATEVVKYTHYLDRHVFEIILSIASFIIGCAGIVTFGVMLVKHFRDIFRK